MKDVIRTGIGCFLVICAGVLCMEAGIQTAGTVLVNLDATHPSAGSAEWVNTGTLGNFTRQLLFEFF